MTNDTEQAILARMNPQPADPDGSRFMEFLKSGFTSNTGNGRGQYYRDMASQRRKDIIDGSKPGEPLDGSQLKAMDAELGLAERFENEYGDNVISEDGGNTGTSATYLYDFDDEDPAKVKFVGVDDAQQNRIADNVSEPDEAPDQGSDAGGPLKEDPEERRRLDKMKGRMSRAEWEKFVNSLTPEMIDELKVKTGIDITKESYDPVSPDPEMKSEGAMAAGGSNATAADNGSFRALYSSANEPKGADPRFAGFVAQKDNMYTRGIPSPSKPDTQSD